MTAIVNTIWGGRVCQVVDRQITRRPRASSQLEVVDPVSTKVCVVLCSDALVSIAYTGVAVAHLQWMDSVIASCLAHRNLASAMIQPGAPMLGGPLDAVVRELAINLNGRLNSDTAARGVDLKLSVVGWHLGRHFTPLAWELARGPSESNGRRYFQVTRHAIGKFLRAHPNGLWAEALGDTGRSIDEKLQALADTRGFSHDDVEVYIKNAVVDRSRETVSVGSDCLAVQLDPLDPDGQVQFTYYPNPSSQDTPTFLSAWVLTPTIACAPAVESTLGSSPSPCGGYVMGGFEDGRANLSVRTRLPASVAHHGGPSSISYSTQERASPRL